MTTKPQTLLPLPDPPEREPDDMTSVQHLGENGNLHHLVQYLGNPETTIVSGERYIVPAPGTPSNQRIAPDMLISFNSDPALYRQDNGYVISRQGKPPDLVMEIASERTGKNDVEDKPARYAALGIPEYWRFDETGGFHGSRLAGDRLVDGQYEPIATLGGRGRSPAGLQHCAEPFHPVGTRSNSVGATHRQGGKYPPSSRKGRGRMRPRKPRHRPSKAAWQPRPECGSWRRNWRGGTKMDRSATTQHQFYFADDPGSAEKVKRWKRAAAGSVRDRSAGRRRIPITSTPGSGNGPTQPRVPS